MLRAMRRVDETRRLNQGLRSRRRIRRSRLLLTHLISLNVTVFDTSTRRSAIPSLDASTSTQLERSFPSQSLFPMHASKHPSTLHVGSPRRATDNVDLPGWTLAWGSMSRAGKGQTLVSRALSRITRRIVAMSIQFTIAQLL